jgi:hypothetical protein
VPQPSTISTALQLAVVGWGNISPTQTTQGSRSAVARFLI